MYTAPRAVIFSTATRPRAQSGAPPSLGAQFGPIFPDAQMPQEGCHGRRNGGTGAGNGPAGGRRPQGDGRAQTFTAPRVSPVRPMICTTFSGVGGRRAPAFDDVTRRIRPGRKVERKTCGQEGAGDDWPALQ